MVNSLLALTYQLKLRLTRLALKPDALPKPVVYVGNGASTQLAKLIIQFGFRRLLIVTDGPIVALGLLEPLRQQFEAAGVGVTVFDRIVPDPPASVVADGLELARRCDCDAVLGFGGGSSMDAAKIIALAAANNTGIDALLGLNKAKLPPLPLFAIPTTAGTGSEVTLVAVVSNDTTHEKQVVVDARIVPSAAALDPALMLGLPPAVTAATGMDAMTHAIEAYIGTWGNDDTDRYARTAIKLIFENLQLAFSDGADSLAREAMALASYYAGLAFTRAMVGYVHAISHQLGGHYGIPHGVANAVVLPHVLEYLRPAAAGKLAELAELTGCSPAGSMIDDAALAFIERIRAMNTALGISAGFAQIRTEDIAAIVTAALKEGSNYPVPKYMDRADCTGIVTRLRQAGLDAPTN